MYYSKVNAGTEVLGIGGEDKTKRKTLADELEEIENKYGANPSGTDTTAPESLELKKLIYDAPTDGAIKELASQQAQLSFESAAAKAADEAQRKQQEAETKKTAAYSQLESAGKQTDETYDKAIKDAENQALKRGLGRSSIIMGQIKAYDSARASEKGAQTENYYAKITALDDEIGGLEEARIKAIEELDSKRLSEISQKIDSLTKERDEKIAEVIKYNNTVAEKQAEYKLSYDKTKASLQAQALKNADNAEIASKISAEKENAAKQYLNALSPQEAVSLLLTDARLREKLGSSYVYMLNFYRSKL